MKFILHWFISALGIIIAAYLINGFAPGSVVITSLWSALVAALILGVVNALIKPVLLVLTLPVTLVTLGLFALVINALMVMLVSGLTPGFKVSGFFTALVFSVVLSVLGWFLHKIA
jgi:putative membrane protein